MDIAEAVAVVMVRAIRRGLLAALFALVLLAAIGVVSQHRFEARCRTQSWPGASVPAPGGAVHVWCEGAGAPLVLLESSGLSGASQYARVLPALARRTTTCAWDRPGMGTSDAVDAIATAPDLGERIWTVLATRQTTGPVVVVGASAGALISLYLARAHADRVVGVVLLDGLTPEGAARFAQPLAHLAGSARQGALLARFGMLRALDPFRLSARDACLTYRPSVFAAAYQLLSHLSESARLVNLAPRLPDTIPIVVLRHGRIGDLVGSAASFEEQRAAEPDWVQLQEAIAKQSKRGRVEVVADSGHLIADDQPRAVVRAVDEVLEMARANLDHHEAVAPRP